MAVGLLFGNVYYAYMAGRLAYKENRDDVTAQPYGINTTGAFITLGAINLEALFSCVFDQKNLDKVFDDNKPTEAGKDAADKAFAIAVAANFITGIFEILGCLFAEPIRAVIPPPAYYAMLTGVGFVFLAFNPMISIAAEPIACMVPSRRRLRLLRRRQVQDRQHGPHDSHRRPGHPPQRDLRLGGRLQAQERRGGHVRHAPAHRQPEPVRGHQALAAPAWGRASTTPSTCTARTPGRPGARRRHLRDISAGMDTITPLMGTILVVAVVGFAASLAGTESAAAAGDDYPMAESPLVDEGRHRLGAIFGSFYGTTIYIGHPIHKTLGAKRGYSVLNGLIYFIVLWSGLFASLYKVIPGCANGALLIFVGLFMCRQAIEDVPPDYYPATFFGLFPCLCNWAALRVDPGSNGDGGWWAGGTQRGAEGMGINFMGQGGGEWFTLIMTSIFCYCTDRNFKAGAIMCAIATFLQLLTGIPTIYNAPTAGKKKYDFIPRMGPERVGYYPKKAHDANFSWMWTVAFAMCTIFFLLQFALQRAGIIDPPIVREKPGVRPRPRSPTRKRHCRRVRKSLAPRSAAYSARARPSLRASFLPSRPTPRHVDRHTAHAPQRPFPTRPQSQPGRTRP